MSNQSLNLTIYIILSRAAYVNRLLGKICNLFCFSWRIFYFSIYKIYRIRSISAEIERPSVASLLGCLGFRSKHTPSVHVYLRHVMLLHCQDKSMRTCITRAKSIVTGSSNPYYQMVPQRGYAPRPAGYKSAVLLLYY